MCENVSRLGVIGRTAIETVFQSIGHESSEVLASPPVFPRLFISEMTTPRGIISRSIKEWLEEALSSSSNIKTLTESSFDVIEKGDEDLRIREWRAEEREPMKKYKAFATSLMVFERLLKVSC
jgi:hypothetical protein